MPQPTLKDIDDLLNTPGDHCDLGCDPEDVGITIQRWKQAHPQTPYCVVNDWMILDLICVGTFGEYYSQRGIQPVVLIGYVVEDEQYRGEAGGFIRTSPLKEMIDERIFMTRSTGYILSGPGTRKRANPAHVASLVF